MEVGFKVDNDADLAVYKLFRKGKVSLAWDTKKHDFIVTVRKNGYE